MLLSGSERVRKRRESSDNTLFTQVFPLLSLVLVFYTLIRMFFSFKLFPNFLSHLFEIRILPPSRVTFFPGTKVNVWAGVEKITSPGDMSSTVKPSPLRPSW